MVAKMADYWVDHLVDKMVAMMDCASVEQKVGL